MKHCSFPAVLRCVISFFVLSLSLLHGASRSDEYDGRYPREVEVRASNAAAHHALRNLRSFLEIYYDEHRIYPASYEETVKKMPYAFRQGIHLQYRLLKPLLYEIKSYQERSGTVEYMMRSDSAELFVRAKGYPNAEFKPEKK